MLEGRRMFRIVLSPAGFPNFCQSFVRHCRFHENVRCKNGCAVSSIAIGKVDLLFGFILLLFCLHRRFIFDNRLTGEA